MTLVALALAASGVIATPTQALAATSECNYGTWLSQGSPYPGSTYRYFFPSYHTTAGWDYFDCYLRNGDFNNFGVVALQNALIRCYGQAITPDGDFGTLTERALKNVQTVHGLKVDGIYGPDTYGAMWFPYYRVGAQIDDPIGCRPSGS